MRTQSEQRFRSGLTIVEMLTVDDGDESLRVVAYQVLMERAVGCRVLCGEESSPGCVDTHMPLSCPQLLLPDMDVDMIHMHHPDHSHSHSVTRSGTVMWCTVRISLHKDETALSDCHRAVQGGKNSNKHPSTYSLLAVPKSSAVFENDVWAESEELSSSHVTEDEEVGKSCG